MLMGERDITMIFADVPLPPRDEKASSFQAVEASSLQVAAAGPRPRAMHTIASHLQNLAQQNEDV
jgi:hypothetical protein